MKKILILILIMCTLFTFYACDNNDNEDEDAPVDLITITDGKLYIALKGNYTTGYTWTYSIEDENIVKLDNEKYTPYESHGMVGVGGVYRAELKGIDNGTTEVKFSYLRTFEDSIPIETHTIQIVVENNKIISALEKTVE